MIDEIKDNISRTIIFYANQTLRTIALYYRYIRSSPPASPPFLSPDEVSCDMTITVINSVEDSRRPGVRFAVSTCREAGVTIEMYAGGHVLTALFIATQCGIYATGDVIGSPLFRTLDPQERLEVVPY